MHRRHFIRSAFHMTAAAALGLPCLQLHAAPGHTSSPRFLFVFLRGGMDAASLLIPTSSSFYYEARPDIASAQPNSDGSRALLLTTDWGLHPVFRNTLYPLFQRGELAFVPFSGTDGLSRSHFETQDNIELGQLHSGSMVYGSGFLNRLAAQLQGSTSVFPMAFTEQLPIALQGSLHVPNTSLRNWYKPSVDARQSGIITGMYRGNVLESSVQSGFAMREHGYAGNGLRDGGHQPRSHDCPRLCLGGTSDCPLYAQTVRHGVCGHWWLEHPCGARGSKRLPGESPG
jgi:uncharacterized protein (DUF1501 family)